MPSMLIEDKRFGNTSQIKLTAHRYATTNNICLRGECAESGEPWCTYTSNFDFPLPDGQVAIKNWGENVGVTGVLIAEGVIEPEMQDCIQSGYIFAGVHKLTERAMKELGLV